MSAIGTAEIARRDEDVMPLMTRLGEAARAAGMALSSTSTEDKNTALLAAAAEIRVRTGDILEANDADMKAARDSDLGAAKLDRLALDETRIEGIAKGLEEVAELADPVGDVIAECPGEGDAFASADIDPERVRQVRRELPSLANRRF